MGLDLPAVASAQGVAFVLVLTRVGTLFLLAPVFGSQMIPSRIKLIAAGAIAVALVPIASDGATLPTDVLGIALLVAKEAGVGLAFSFALSILSAAIQAGAGLLDTIVGYSYSAVLDPITGNQSAVLAQFYAVFALAVLILVGGDHVMIMGLAKSYEVVPLDAFPSLGTVTELAAHGFAQVFVVGLEITAPVVLTLLLVESAFGLVARAVPQMNVFIVGLPAKVIVSFAAIAASLPFVGNFFQDELTRSVSEALRVLGMA